MSTADDPEISVTILDIKTGQTKECHGWTELWWTEGNGSCDCNRAIFMGHHHLGGVCLGCNRYLIIKVNGSNLPLEDFNGGYPVNLLTRKGMMKSKL